jgi:hypothetical protein
MARMAMEDYRERYLRKVEDHLMSIKDQIPHFTTRLLNDAIRQEMNRADEDTWEVDVPDSEEQAIKEAEERILKIMKENFDLGVGKTF